MGLNLGGIGAWIKAHKAKIGLVAAATGGYLAGVGTLRDFLRAVVDVLVK